MEKKMIDEIREFFQSFIAPQLQGIKGDLRAIDARIDAMSNTLNAKIDGKFETIDARINTLDVQFDTKLDVVLAKIDAVDFKVESYRRELLAEIHRKKKGRTPNLLAGSSWECSPLALRRTRP